MNVLITSASRKVGLVRAFQSALARHGGGCVVAVDTSPFAPALYLADRHFLVPPTTDPHFIDQIAELCQRESVGLIVPTRDEELPIFAAARSRLERQGRRVLAPRSKPFASARTNLLLWTSAVPISSKFPAFTSRASARMPSFPSS